MLNVCLKSLTHWFLYQTVQVWVGMVLVAFPNMIGVGMGGELFGKIR